MNKSLRDKREPCKSIRYLYYSSLRSLTISINNHDRFCFFTICHYKSLTPAKSMPKKNNYDYKEKYPYIPVGTFEPMRIESILTKNCCFFAVRASVLEYE